jgi:hypothetical protein
VNSLFGVLSGELLGRPDAGLAEAFWEAGLLLALTDASGMGRQVGPMFFPVRAAGLFGTAACRRLHRTFGGELGDLGFLCRPSKPIQGPAGRVIAPLRRGWNGSGGKWRIAAPEDWCAWAVPFFTSVLYPSQCIA